MVERRLALAAQALHVLVPAAHEWVADRKDTDPLTELPLFEYSISLTPDEVGLEWLSIKSFNGIELIVKMAAKAAEVIISIENGKQEEVLVDRIVRIESIPRKPQVVNLYRQVNPTTISGALDFDHLLGKYQDEVLKLG